VSNKDIVELSNTKHFHELFNELKKPYLLLFEAEKYELIYTHYTCKIILYSHL